jgi:hypothetical protein
MLTEHRSIPIQTSDGSTLEAEVNYSSDKEVKDSQMIRFHFGDKTADVKMNDLIALIFFIGDETTAEKIMPMKRTKVRKIQKLLAFEWTATQDYKKGDKIGVQAPYIETVEDSEEMMANAVANAMKRGQKFKINHRLI